MISPATSSRITSGFISVIDCNRRPSIKCLKPLWVDQKYLWNFQHSYMLSIQYYCNRIYWNCAFNVHNTMKKKKKKKKKKVNLKKKKKKKTTQKKKNKKIYIYIYIYLSEVKSYMMLMMFLFFFFNCSIHFLFWLVLLLF